MTLCGFLAYLLSGLGLGGAALLLPVLSRFTDLSSARADTMIAYLPAALAACVVHGLKGKRPKTEMLALLPVGLMGAVLGGLAAGRLPVKIFRYAYGAFLLFFGLKMLINGTKVGETLKNWKIFSKIRKIFCKFFNFF